MAEMFAPDGTVKVVPDNQVQAALQAGGKPAVRMLSPKGEPKFVPADMVDTATKAGGIPLPGVQPPTPQGELPGGIQQYSNIDNTNTLPMSGLSSRTAAKISDQFSGAPVGAAKGLVSTLDRIGGLIVPGKPAPSDTALLQPASNETGGYTAEQLAEFVAPGGLIGKAGKAAEVATAAQTGMRFLPTIARAATEGTAMGGIAALHGGDTKDVVETAALGGLGPVVESGLGTAGKFLASKVPSLNPTDAIVSALAPAKKIAKTLPGNVDRAMPLLLDAEKTTGTAINSVDALADNARAARQKVWGQVEDAQKAAGATGAMVVGQSAGDAGMEAALAADKVQPVSDETWAAIQRDVDFYGKPTSPVDAEQRIQTLNAQLKTFYGKSGVDQASVLRANPEMAAKAAIADALRADLDTTMQAATGTGAKDLKGQYAALRQVESAALDRSARIGVSDARQQFSGKNMAALYAKPVIGTLPGLAIAGHGAMKGDPTQIAEGLGTAAVGGYLGKTANADSLIEAAFNGARSGGSKIATAAKAANALTVPAARTAAATNALSDAYNRNRDMTGID
jgi:hypothetical protein